MRQEGLLILDGEVERPLRLTFADLVALDASYQVVDLGRIDARRQGDAIQLAGLLAQARPRPAATYLTLHASKDDFHVSVPLADVRDRALLIYRLADCPLPAELGGPLRFFIPDLARCHTAELDECANVKFVDHIELSVGPGRDNRPQDEAAHAALHQPRT